MGQLSIKLAKQAAMRRIIDEKLGECPTRYDIVILSKAMTTAYEKMYLSELLLRRLSSPKTLFMIDSSSFDRPSNYFIDRLLPAKRAKDFKNEMADFWDEWVDEYGPEKALKIWRQNVRSNIFGYYWQAIKDKCSDILDLGAKFIGLGGN